MDLQETDELGFLNTFIENAMFMFWPHPTRNFYCRTCNFIEFPDQQTLDEHKRTQQHLQLEASEKEAFCFVCQCHAHNAEMMEEHCQTERHYLLADLFEKARENALKLWKEKISSCQNTKSDCKEKNNKNDKTWSSSLSKGNVRKGQTLKRPLTDIKNIDKADISLDQTDVANYEMCDSFMFKKTDESNSDDEKVKINIISQGDKISENTNRPSYAKDVKLIKERMMKYIADHTEVIVTKSRSLISKTIAYAMHPYSNLDSCLRNKRFNCKLCKVNFKSIIEMNSHGKSEQHIKLNYLLEECTKLCMTEIKKAENNYEESKKNFAYVHQLLYPKNKLGLISDSHCYACCDDSKDILDHVKTFEHQQYLRSYYEVLKENGFVFSDGCAMCEETKIDSIGSHKNSLEHKLNIIDYRKFIGLIENDDEKDELNLIASSAQLKSSSNNSNSKNDVHQTNLIAEKIKAVVERSTERKKQYLNPFFHISEMNDIPSPPYKKARRSRHKK